MLKHTNIDGMKDIGYNINCRGDAFDIPDEGFRGSNDSIFHLLVCIKSLLPISLSREYHLLEV